MPRTVILGSARTPVGKMGGGLSSLHSTDLGGIAIGAALERADVAPEQVQHVVMGQVLQAGVGQIPSRQAQIKAEERRERRVSQQRPIAVRLPLAPPSALNPRRHVRGGTTSSPRSGWGRRVAIGVLCASAVAAGVLAAAFQAGM